MEFHKKIIKIKTHVAVGSVAVGFVAVAAGPAVVAVVGAATAADGGPTAVVAFCSVCAVEVPASQRERWPVGFAGFAEVAAWTCTIPSATLRFASSARGLCHHPVDSTDRRARCCAASLFSDCLARL